MTPSLRRGVLLILLIALLMVSVGWAWNSYCQSRRQWSSALRETAACRQLAAALKQLKEGAEPTQGVEMPEGQLYQKVHQAAQAAGLEENQVIRGIRPQPARVVRAGRDGSYQQKTVELSLQGLTMEQLVGLLHHLQTDPPQLQIAGVTLHEPKGMGPATLWNVEPLVLGYRVQTPAKAALESSNP